ncbi:MAG: efflux RND transporter periplasmic adaptor subunit [Desulfobulbaceae bacterium]|jgi:HlyD family secretion protein|nr:efflux RND transporter periplasmic adaptor subunit [Desulfobulbaceae bacterium]HKJ13395.1 efflux RND transporter periplasmic adaptor subunit [Desulfobulbales bacterium]MDH3541039.1 efflux RND transporter periplasmic adaptor subunit [Desulfobulbaceae bacterium]MDH3776207.1 efflux RND transporter periplasmic adaptor subunit [Desulfobulbaceae bacterium]MDH3781367.1 efflux RND transporter periplasmic adaptor subunit [Desulfobulbaceae bacterium]
MPRHSLRWFIILLLILLAGVFAWYKMRPKEIEVSVVQVTLGTVEKIVANTRAGTLNACRKANLSPATGGQISVLTVDEGDVVKEGQLLLELWNNDLKAQAALAGKEIMASEAMAAVSRLQAEIASREAERMQKLIQDNAISDQDADKIITEAKVRQAAYDAAVTEVAASRARVSVIKANLERTMLVAPFDGIIAKINGELNEYVTPSPPGIPTPPTIELLDTSCFYVVAPIDEVDAAAVKVNMEARVIMDAFGDKHFPARVRRIDPYVLDLEKQARTVDVEVEFTNSEDGENFLAGYSADVEIIIAVEEDVLRIPTQALLDNSLVYVYQPHDQRLHEKSVRTGLSNWDYTQVTEGLQEGESLVISTDRPGLEDGVRVKISEE